MHQPSVDPKVMPLHRAGAPTRKVAATMLNKEQLIGGCMRLPLRVDAERLRDEIATLPASLWGGAGGRVGVHSVASAIFLRGHAPAEGSLPIDDREPLALLPYVRHIIFDMIPAPPQRCLLAKLPAGEAILPHVDRPKYFGGLIRLHAPIISAPTVHMYCAGLVYRMAPGEVWALNNSTVHAVLNTDQKVARIHLICDFLPSPDLLDLLSNGERHLGESDENFLVNIANYVATKQLTRRTRGPIQEDGGQTS